MIETKFNKGWKFWTDNDAFELVSAAPDTARQVTLPHDAMLEQQANPQSLNKGNTGYRDGGVYNYVKFFYAEETYRHKTLMLKFEGIYMNAFVYINGMLACKQPYGYTTFYVTLNDYLKYGEENEISIVVRNGAMANSRWYSGGGIYRDVYLLISEPTYLIPDGVQIVTESIEEEYATVMITSEIKNRKYTTENLTLETVIQDKKGMQVTTDTIPVILTEGEELMIRQRITVIDPKSWSEQTPNLYTCISTLRCKEEIIDVSETTFGLRTLLVDAKKGIRINGNSVKLRGACIHHDSGLLGAATYDDAQYRQVAALKGAGFNAIRMSHHPMAPSMLRACDELGMYVMDESFDMWNRCKSDYDYALYFEEWWEKDVTAMVRKDFNHPSVLMYSVGNEIPEIGSIKGVQTCSKITEKIKSLDSTRYTLASINGVFAASDAMDQIVADVAKSLKDQGVKGNVNNFITLMDAHMDKIVTHPEVTKRLEMACSATDIAGYNYMTARYETDGVSYPDRVIVGSETTAPAIAANWELVKKHPYLIGDFTWTGWDYIGEAGIGIPAYQRGEGGFDAKFPCQLAYCGDVDITGFRRPASYFREIVFGLRKDPYIAVQNPYRYGENLIKTVWVISDSISSWTYEHCEEKPVIVEVYAPGDEVELFLNGMSIGKKTAGAEVGFKTCFETAYQPGELVAVAYENGIEIGRMCLKTAGNNRRLVMRKEACRSKELVYVQVEIQDENGIAVTGVDTEIHLETEGGMEAIGFGSGNPKPSYSFAGNKTETFNGRALLILKKGGMEELTTIRISAEGYATASIEI